MTQQEQESPETQESQQKQQKPEPQKSQQSQQGQQKAETQESQQSQQSQPTQEKQQGTPEKPEQQKKSDQQKKQPEKPESQETPDQQEKPSPDSGRENGQQEQQQRQDEMDVREDIQPRAKVQWRDKQGGYADTTGTLEPLMDASPQDWLGSNQDPDVLLAVPNLGVDHIGLVVDNLKAHVELHAKVLDLLELHVGADVAIEKVDLQIDNVRVQAMLKVKLDNVVKIVGRVMDTIDANPEILTNLTAGLGKGLETGLGKEHATQLERQPGRLKGVESSEKEGDGAAPAQESEGNGERSQGDGSSDSGESEGGWSQSPELSQPKWSNPGEDDNKKDANDQQEDK